MNNESVILIVDDLPNNLKVISSVLKNDYKISLAKSGKMALDILENVTPDLILLDIMMPEMDGYETIRLIKQKQRLKDIPVIFLTAKTEIDDIVKGFDLGAVDYITKPFNQREVKVRIRNQIMLKNALEENKQHNLELQAKNKEIHELNDELIKRNEDLVIARDAVEEHAHKTNYMYQRLLESEEKIKKQNAELKTVNSEKDKFFSIIAHDLRSPFSGLLGLSQMIISEFEEMTREELLEIMEQFNTSLSGLHKLINNLLEWSRIQKNTIKLHPENLHIRMLVENIETLQQTNLNEKRISCVNNVDENFRIYADENTMHTVLRNLISNAIKYTEENGKITINSISTDKEKIITIKDSGIGIPAEIKKNLFSIGEKTSRNGTQGEKGTGLGLVLCKEFINKNNGSISVKSIEGEGSTFILKFKDNNDNFNEVI